MADIAKIFWSGRSQAVRLPKAFRFDADMVRIRREGETVILEPIDADDEWGWLERAAETIDPAVLDAIIEAVEEDVPEQERPELDDL